MTEAQRQHRFLVILAFGLVYLFWGSTYLGIRIAVEHIPPALMCGTRFSIAGILMLAYCGLAGRGIRYSPLQLRHMAIVGILLLMGGNLTLSYAEQLVPSGLAALVIASTPLWFLVLDSMLLGHHRISSRGLGGLAFSWALGSVLSKRWQSAEVDPFSGIAWQVTFAGLANLVFALFFEDISRVEWTARGIGAVFYLIVCGSWIGYTAYIWLLRHVPTSKVSTYAYVNPVVAVFLGWLVLNEKVDGYILAGTAIVIASVVLVTSAKVEGRTIAAEMPTAEPAGD
jgi:drug/metabolite transporter (DMT)-like permease